MTGHTPSNPKITGWRHWLLVFGADFRFVRRFLGGHWELWWAEPCQAYLWIDVNACSLTIGSRPCGCVGNPTCEDWP